MQITSGIRAILSYPIVYSSFQRLMGAKSGWIEFVNDYVRPKINDKILDIGCGPADLLNYLPEIKYYGFDINESYIAKAKKKFGKNGNFYCKILDTNDLKNFPKFDLVIASGLLHHLNDNEAKNILNLAFKALKPNGRMITIDPCFVPNQNPIAFFLISKDRGQNIRNQSKYTKLAKSNFSNVKVTIKHKFWIPYTHCIMECSK
jgi:SAM-dependent methyltransferase